MNIIDKKLWPDFFDKDKNIPLDFKLADFDLKPGDKIRFREWDPVTKKYTGRSYLRKVKRVFKNESPTRYWSQEELEKYGWYLIEFL